jgi:NAD(P)-dependent dehydrogenase (short-subunit alcohol dehydrogenase family)
MNPGKQNPIVFVAGGAGAVGEGIVQAWLDAGATVAVTSRSPERLEELRGRLDSARASRLRTFAGALGGPQSAELVARIVGELGPIDHAVASVGGAAWKLAPLSQLASEDFRRVVEDGINAHFEVAQAVLPRLRQGGSYTFINGGAALVVEPAIAPMVLVAKAQLALKDLYAAETPRERARINSLLLNTPIITRVRPQGREGWVSAYDTGRACVALSKRVELHGVTIRLDKPEDAETLPLL